MLLSGRTGGPVSHLSKHMTDTPWWPLPLGRHAVEAGAILRNGQGALPFPLPRLGCGYAAFVHVPQGRTGG